jgi:hypothetical protein
MPPQLDPKPQTPMNRRSDLDKESLAWFHVDAGPGFAPLLAAAAFF